jgi:ABC-type antimicrobial peptide transport system permease subunit
MISKLKKALIIIGCVIAAIVIIALLIVTAGKNKQIKKLLAVVTNTWKKNVATKEAENVELDTAYDALTDQEKAILHLIETEPSLKLPDDIDKNDYSAVLTWFRSREQHYD